jgi:hypothetical protein
MNRCAEVIFSAELFHAPKSFVLVCRTEPANRFFPEAAGTALSGKAIPQQPSGFSSFQHF